jgi:altronate dehydratase small subunit
MPVKALVLHPDDNVATAVRGLPAGEEVGVTVASGGLTVKLRQAVPPGHKFALRDIASGGEVIKYGETIGQATAPIKKGEHAHLHNVAGLRGRGDRP